MQHAFAKINSLYYILASFDLFLIYPLPPTFLQFSSHSRKTKMFSTSQKWILNFLERILKLFGSIPPFLPHSQPFNVCSQQVRTVQGRNSLKISIISLNGSSASIHCRLASVEIYLGCFHFGDFGDFTGFFVLFLSLMYFKKVLSPFLDLASSSSFGSLAALITCLAFLLNTFLSATFPLSLHFLYAGFFSPLLSYIHLL